MSNKKFIFANPKGSKDPKAIFKKSLPFVGIGLIVILILSILILPSRSAKYSECEELGLGGGISTILAGQCEKSFNEIIFVVGDTQNSPRPELNYPEYINTALNINKASVSAISASTPHRNPKTIISYEDSKKAKDFESAVRKHLESASATEDGADYLGAIQTAAKYAEHKDKTLIYVIGSGLSDRGLLNFADGNLLDEQNATEAITKQIAEYLSDSSDSLKGITIVWDGNGQVVAPQSPLSTKDFERLKTIYTQAFTALGAHESNIRFKNKLSNDESSNTTHTVKATNTHEDKIDITDVFDGSTSTFQFVGDSAQFVDYNSTEQEATKKAEELSNHPSARMTITAYMSRGADCSRQEADSSLLNARLESVKSILVSKGADPNRIKLIAGGFGNEPECENGHYNEVIGAKNRRVEINIKN